MCADRQRTTGPCRVASRGIAPMSPRLMYLCFWNFDVLELCLQFLWHHLAAGSDGGLQLWCATGFASDRRAFPRFCDVNSFNCLREQVPRPPLYIFRQWGDIKIVPTATGGSVVTNYKCERRQRFELAVV